VQFDGLGLRHPSGNTTSVCQIDVEMKTFTDWGGVPTEMLKEEKSPSLPSTTLVSSLRQQG
jgi:hypothetical protein